MRNKNIIYKATHIESGKCYVGATKNSLEMRKAEHILKAKNSTGGYFQETIATQGPDAFTWTQIDTANSIDELAQKEKAYILEYDSKENGFNSDCGGGIQKTVFQYTIEGGKLVNSYDSLKKAADAVDANKRSISSACLGVNKTCKGFYWSYVHPLPIILKDARKKVVRQMDLDGHPLAEYDSLATAAKTTGISKTCISRCCRGERDKSGGYRWSYD